ncbi:MAG TPA: YMGG-like glycine zipper-containing protein [Blastocatellia bacterium]|nr:YMGG-like glycine zipper-containing protein [Blastocatellia bacterium]
MVYKTKSNIPALLLTLFAVTLTGAGFSAAAQYTSQYPSRANDRQAGQILNRLTTEADTFRRSLDTSFNASRSDGSRWSDEMRTAVTEFQSAAAQLRDNFRYRRDISSGLQDLLNRAERIDSFMQRSRSATGAVRDWNVVRADLTRLAGYYNITWPGSSYSSDNRGYSTYPNDNRGNSNYPNDNRRYGSGNLLTGTYRLNTSSSEDSRQAVERAARGLSYDEQQRVSERLTRRLESPDTIAIDRRGRSITLASTRAPQMTFEADGSTRTETMPSGRTIRVSSTLSGNQLVVSTTGDRGSDFHVTFDPINNGQQLRVTRRIYDERLSQPVIVTSIYDRTSDVAQMQPPLYTGGDRYPGYDRRDGSFGNTARGSFSVPDGTQLVAVLDTDMTTQNTHSGDRFSMVVRSPSQYNGAVIEGIVRDVSRSGRIAGRAEMALDFERIRMRDGRTYNFAGYIESVRTPNGDNVRVDNEGSVKEDSSQTSRTVTRAGIGAAVGALIGAIAGGGKGAAIGAAVGAGAGAGSIFIQGRDDLELRSGTELTIRASAPGSQALR